MRTSRSKLLWMALVMAAALAAAHPELAVASGGFTPTGNLTTGRQMATATLLPNGKVLITGGLSGPTAEIYDPGPGTFALTSNAETVARNQATATLLGSGKVLIAGGCAGGTKGAAGPYGIASASAELYDPETAKFTRTGNLSTARFLAVATLLPGGKVLIAGGRAVDGAALASAELYDPKTGRFTSTGNLAVERDQTTATLLPSGKVLIAGGHRPGGNDDRRLIAWGVARGLSLSTAELFDPATGRFTTAGSLTTERSGATATLLPGGKVLIAGGRATYGEPLASAELYDPATARFSATGSMATGRRLATATLLRSGKVLIVGGLGTLGYVVDAELYDPASGTFTAAGSLTTEHNLGTATLLPTGKVLIAGGFAKGFSKKGAEPITAELYDPDLNLTATAGPAASRGGRTRAGRTAVPEWTARSR